MFKGYLKAPHPMVVPMRSGGRWRTKYIMITFKGTQYYEPILGYGTHGDFYVMEAAQRVNGYEFRPR